jgi:hypothetical protein
MAVQSELARLVGMEFTGKHCPKINDPLRVVALHLPHTFLTTTGLLADLPGAQDRAFRRSTMPEIRALVRMMSENHRKEKEVKRTTQIVFIGVIIAAFALAASGAQKEIVLKGTLVERDGVRAIQIKKIDTGS